MPTPNENPARATSPTLTGVPKQTRPPKVAKSIRIRPWLLTKVESVCDEQELTFNEAVERGLELWLAQQQRGE
jgi:hypothetical protein